MWRFKPFGTKEQTGLEGRCIDVNNVKVNVKNVIAEGGFSCVYLARDAITVSKQYALKHIICNDEESLQLVMKEIKVLKSLKGHPNVVTLHSHAIFDMGRTKEALLVMEFCENTLVSVLESRGSGYFEEEQILIIFRDVCNAVFAMHCRSPPIAHRDLKAENLLLGQDGLWKLCDFGSASTNHKCFEKPEEMGIEEDNIRKHTTPAYRAPEMWDLFRKELINEKVDIWALGCLLFRICYFKSAFDGESKLQVLNGNYRIPDVPKYSSAVTDLIRDMLQSSPDARPDITQVWFRVNQQLPAALQKSLPDQLPDIRETIVNTSEVTAGKTSAPRRSPPPPPPPPSETTRNSSSPRATIDRAGGSSLGAFWATQHAKDSIVREGNSCLDKHVPGTNHSSESSELKVSVEDSDYGNVRLKEKKPDSTRTFGNDTFNAFVADFDTSKLSSSVCSNRLGKGGSSDAEVEGLREQLKRANLEKAEINSKYEKLAAICRSQRQEIQELKQALHKASSPSKDALKNQSSIENQTSPAPPRKLEGSVWELQQGVPDKHSPSPESKQWQPFAQEPKPQMTSSCDGPKSVRTINGHQKKQNSGASSSNDGWGFENESFTAVPAGSALVSKSAGEGNSSKRFGGSNRTENKGASQPAGWSGF